MSRRYKLGENNKKGRDKLVVLITGLAGAGKSTIAMTVFEKLKSMHFNTVLLDGDIFRDVLGNYGYSLGERLELAKKISALCSFLNSQDVNVVCATMSLFKEIHQLNKNTITNYYEVYVKVGFEELKRRDKKGLYSQALSGEINNVVGVDLPFDEPQNPDIVIENSFLDNLQEKADIIISFINNKHLDTKTYINSYSTYIY